MRPANWRRPGFVLLFAGTCALLGLVVLPFAVVTLGAFLPASFLGVSTEQWAAGGGGPGDGGFFNPRWFAYVWNLYRGPLAFSCRLAVACSAGCLLVGMPAGYALAGKRRLS